MSGSASIVAAPLPGPARRPMPAGRGLALRVISFAALALFAGAHYAGLVADGFSEGVVAAIAVAACGGVALALSDRAPGPRPLALMLRVALLLVTSYAALLLVGVPYRMLEPAHLGALGASLDHGLGGLDSFQWPYVASDRWIRLTILLAIPAVSIPAAAIAFWPGQRLRRSRSGTALVLLLALYATGVTELPQGVWAIRGVALLVLIAAFLWLPRLRSMDALRAGASLAVCGVTAVALATVLPTGRPWFDYHGWNLFSGVRAGAEFQWDQAYGPIDWPRSGRVVLNVRSSRPHYWKVETLDRFDGSRWLRSESPPLDGRSDLPRPVNRSWIERMRVSIRDLRTPLVVGAGDLLAVDNPRVTARQGDGSVRVLDSPLEHGDSYSALAYVPNPGPAQLRKAPRGFPRALLAYTAFDLPMPGASSVVGRAKFGNAAVVAFAPGSSPSDAPLAERRILISPYARMYRLARSLTTGSASNYDVARAIQGYLARGYRYSERPPLRALPLSAFLFQDHVGYCQQFSGAMALMLRMNGIPARVAAGFAPGSYDSATRTYRVRDLDAHAWVEVYFSGIGWVTFDPTPSLAPAQRQSLPVAGTEARRNHGLDLRGLTAGAGAGHGTQHLRARRLTTRPSADSLAWVPLGGVGAGALLALIALALRARRGPPKGAVAELRVALRRLDHHGSEQLTLSELESRLRVQGNDAAARYVSHLLAHRFARHSPPGAPSPRDRRALRRALVAGGGAGARLTGWLTIPPGWI